MGDRQTYPKLVVIAAAVCVVATVGDVVPAAVFVVVAASALAVSPSRCLTVAVAVAAATWSSLFVVVRSLLKWQSSEDEKPSVSNCSHP